MVSVSIILITVLGFSALMTAVTSTASSAQFQMELTRLLDGEQKRLAGVSFTNLMTGTNPPSVCDIGEGVISTQSVRPEIDTLIINQRETQIQREVIWSDSQIPVMCTSEAMKHNEDKTVIITATWVSNEITHSQVSKVRYSHIVGDPLFVRESLSPESVVFLADLDLGTQWCPETTVVVDNTNATNIVLTFTSLSELSCATPISGLTPGESYTGVAIIEVPIGVTAVMTNGSDNSGTLIVGDGTVQTISVTFTANTETVNISLGAQSDIDLLVNKHITIYDLRVYG
jgi:hypothetical protein